ncbi:class I glutamine amidotransferase-like protein [Gigaspora rosea]|uniref:Class I glutamine amidotransferase-like protein n=1 Tax=Gigaspora rosea TaxID=44941 RepID=A0A397U715_9GLOM|nr:class I glutamine amidotransferase-like protein [Gigaspora rosea]
MGELQKILRVSIFLADTPIPKVFEKFGGYDEQISKLLQDTINSKKLKLSLIIKNYDVKNMEFPEEDDLSKMDGIIITGSASSAYDDIPWINRLADFTKLIIDKHQHIKLIGICFGHQIIARAAGGQIIKNPLGWEIGVTEVSLTDVGSNFFKIDNKVLRIQEMHQDHVKILPKGFCNLGFTSKSSIQGMIKGNQVLTVQGHPEFVGESTKIIINARLNKGIFTQEFAQTGLKAADYEDDHVIIGLKFIEFMMGYYHKSPYTRPGPLTFHQF